MSRDADTSHGRHDIAGEDAWLAGALGAFTPSDAVVLGLGHDTAAVRVSRDGIVIATKDVLVDGVHFELEHCGAAAAARKALAVNLSDLAAAAAQPVGFLIGAVLPTPVSRRLFDQLMAGFAEAARVLDCPCLGGDTNAAAGPLVLSVTALGKPGPQGVLSRAGAQVGDILSVTGALGGSLVGRHLHFTPRVAAALALARAGVPHAMMDISDGLSRDLPRLCRASGVGAQLVGRQIPIHPDVLPADGPGALGHALHDGEDFELLLAHPELSDAQRALLAAEAVQLVPIGRVVEAQHGVQIEVGGESRPLEPRGWDHLQGEGLGKGEP